MFLSRSETPDGLGAATRQRSARQPRKEKQRDPKTRCESLDEKYIREIRTTEKEAFSGSLLKIYKKIPGSRLDTQGSFRDGPPADGFWITLLAVSGYCDCRLLHYKMETCQDGSGGTWGMVPRISSSIADWLALAAQLMELEQ
jgi:hypothetical protein